MPQSTVHLTGPCQPPIDPHEIAGEGRSRRREWIASRGPERARWKLLVALAIVCLLLHGI